MSHLEPSPLEEPNAWGVAISMGRTESLWQCGTFLRSLWPEGHRESGETVQEVDCQERQILN